MTGESSGRIADRKWKLAYWKAMKGYYCKVDKRNKTGQRDFLHVFAHEFCLEGFNYRAGDAVNFVIGQGDTMVTPLQLARAYAALSNGGKLMEPRVAKAVVDPQGKLVRTIKPKVLRHIKSKKSAIAYVDNALKGTPREGTLAWKFGGFPLDKVQLRGKTGSAEVYGKQSTSWVATYTKDYVVVMVITQGGTGSGTSGPAVRKIWEHLYGIKGEKVLKSKAAIAGTTPPKQLPTFAARRLDPAALDEGREADDRPPHGRAPRGRPQPRRRPSTGLAPARRCRADHDASAPCWSGRPPPATTCSRAVTPRPTCTSTWSTS